MRVGILGGTGPLGRGLGARLAKAGISVSIGSRDHERAASVVSEMTSRWSGLDLDVEGVANSVAAKAEIVVVATPWEAVVETADEVAADLVGKTVLSVANALIKQGSEIHALIPPRAAVAEALQAALPDSKIVASCHHLPAGPLRNLDEPFRSDVLVCSDHPDAKRIVMELLAKIEGLRPLDAGSLALAGPIEAFTAVLATLNIRYRARSTVNFAGVDTGTSSERER